MTNGQMAQLAANLAATSLCSLSDDKWLFLHWKKKKKKKKSWKWYDAKM